MNKFGCETNCERNRHTAEMMLPNVNWKMKNSNEYEIGFSTNEMTASLLSRYLLAEVDNEFHN